MKNTEMLGEIYEYVLSQFSKKCGVDIENLLVKDSVADLVQENWLKLGIMMTDFHEKFNVAYDYPPLTEVNEFKTIEDVINYFNDRAQPKKGEFK